MLRIIKHVASSQTERLFNCKQWMRNYGELLLPSRPNFHNLILLESNIRTSLTVSVEGECLVHQKHLPWPQT